ncbi:TonB-dependent receptor plug domain-containing protein [Halosquirtibacter xylanolyticus]|uniref:TonB-dependent receptor plug domain-containing protein n=1 Tax=Halosquirtibacter xylanolyticus TaxID=3374599 RepID=UPI0037484F36|nr:TonB-dependent receptor plug domain-containing protein [Prolixibacteraceae bacterium]
MRFNSRISNLIFLTVLYLGIIDQVCAINREAQGILIHQDTKKPIIFGEIYVGKEHQHIFTNDKGQFTYTKSREQFTRIIVRCMGYATKDTLIDNRSVGPIKIYLSPLSFRLKEVQVSAEIDDMGSATIIKSMAIDHIQASSFSDILQMQPGNLTTKPNLSEPNFIRLREAGYDTNSSLGVDFEVDGVSQSNDASFFTNTNAGVDMRNITTDEIESVEIITGIASAKHGDITNGKVIITEKRGETPLSVRLKTEPSSKLVSINKGIQLSNHWSWNISGGYLNSLNDPRTTLNGYTRLSQKNKWNYKKLTSETLKSFFIDLSLNQSVDNVKSDAEIIDGTQNYIKSRYTNISFAITHKIEKKRGFLRTFTWNINSRYTNNYREELKSLVSGATAVSISKEDGPSEGVYLPAIYDAYQTINDNPLQLNASVNANFYKKSFGMIHRIQIGGRWKGQKNTGEGENYNLSRPMNVPNNSQRTVTYPRILKDIPMYQTLSFYLTDDLTHEIAGMKIKHQIGIRGGVILGLSDKYSMSNSWIVDPRWNMTAEIYKGDILGKRSSLKLLGGLGIMSKLPTMAHLYPNTIYFQYQTLNFYSQNEQARRTDFWNQAIDPTNYEIKPSVNKKAEIGVQGRIGKTTFQITTFYEKNNSEFSVHTIPYNQKVQIYVEDKDNAPISTNKKPSLEQFSTQNISSNYLISNYNNNERKVKQGVEWNVSLPKLNTLNTSIRWSGAWFKTHYDNYNSDIKSYGIIHETHTNHIYGIFYNSENRIIQSLNSQLRFHTHIPKFGMIISTTIDNRIYSMTQTLYHDGLPDYYVDVNGDTNLYKDEHSTQLVLKELVHNYSDYNFMKREVPWESHIHLRMTKEIGRHMTCSFYANNIFNIENNYTNYHGQVISRNSTPYFGAEIKYKF